MSAGERDPHDLWIQAGGNRERYLELMIEAGHVVPAPPCPVCAETFRHYHANGRTIRLDVFGHPVAAIPSEEPTHE